MVTVLLSELVKEFVTAIALINELLRKAAILNLFENLFHLGPVSYTHLTLPTIYSV